MTQNDIKKIVEDLIQTFLDAGKVSLDLRKKGLIKGLEMTVKYFLNNPNLEVKNKYIQNDNKIKKSLKFLSRFKNFLLLIIFKTFFEIRFWDAVIRRNY